MRASAEVLAVWDRARRSLKSAEGLVYSDPDSSTSRAYYAAFHGVSALFLLEGQSFKKHSGVEVAVHRDLVNTGRWEKSLGADYTALKGSRAVGDYGGATRIREAEAADAVERATRVLEAVRVAYPDVFEWLEAEPEPQS
ncbi:MAG: HEPN domain-containing protein [Deltaproteobacteria bacterium]|nr:HEPN domain-containing protein [Deltaproteobacteria bacterium]